MKLLLLILMFVLPATKAWAITNGSADVSWNNTLPAGSTVDVQYQSFADPTWKPFTYPTPTVGSDGRMHAFVTWPAFPADNMTDHWLCIRARSILNAQVSVWATGNCAQVPVPVYVPPPPTGLQITSATPDQIVITASTKDCKKVITSTAGSTSTMAKRTIQCRR